MNVALIGASGNIGSHVLTATKATGFFPRLAFSVAM